MSPTILFVDDDREDEQMVRETMQQLNFLTFSFCPNGNAALEHLTTLSDKDLPDLIVANSRLPILNGLELGKALKAHSRFRRIRLAIFTELLRPDIRIMFLQTGVKAVFEKPDNMKELKNTLTNLIALATEQRKLLKGVRKKYNL